ncbi:putative quinol monooxygenase [Subtercola endophyticus]|uniref:putative quinol monooxygenase n=1 Tax=Subtercola endophyticus TaxID=2895559 RepID=UPI001E614E73|nr:antibiotic biosynthesis monooxygenase [Subtercola endophyticus]UFS58773.1 antibiotic biosynthesis monooxygenase [Subtercola endophyticus]
MAHHIRVIVTFDLTKFVGPRDAFITDLIETAERSREEPGCLFYETLQAPGRPDVVVITELWESAEIYDSHHRSRIAYFEANPEKLFTPEMLPGLEVTYEFYHQSEYVMSLEHRAFVPKDESIRLHAVVWAG